MKTKLTPIAAFQTVVPSLLFFCLTLYECHTVALPQCEGQHGYFGPDNSVDKKIFLNKRSFNLSMFLLHPLSITLLRGQIEACSVHHISPFIHHSFIVLALWYVAECLGVSMAV